VICLDRVVPEGMSQVLRQSDIECDILRQSDIECDILRQSDIECDSRLGQSDLRLGTANGAPVSDGPSLCCQIHPKTLLRYGLLAWTRVSAMEWLRLVGSLK